MFDKKTKALAAKLLENYTYAADAIEAAAGKSYVRNFASAIETIKVADSEALDAAWSYFDGFRRADNIRELIRMYADQVWYEAVVQWIESVWDAHKAAVNWTLAEDAEDRDDVRDELSKIGVRNLKWVNENTIRFNFETMNFTSDAKTRKITIE